MEKHAELEQFLELVGRVPFQKGIEMSTQLMTRALNGGGIPARKYKLAQEWCRANNHELPLGIFKWDHASEKPNSGKQNAYACCEHQDHAGKKLKEPDGCRTAGEVAR